MFELIEKAVMTTIGVAAITQKKAEELVCELKEKYKMSEDEGKQFVEKLQSMARENKEKVREMAEAEVQKVVERLGLVSVDELERLKKRVEELEARLNG
jgi:polyhydroxyalkanoate synthesis regulator phasin